MRTNRSRTSSGNSSESESGDDHDEEKGREEDETTSDGLVTYYTVLQVPENAKAIDTYLRLVLTSHPDRIGSSTDPDALAFRTIKDAYDVLSNEAKRREYDMKLHQIRNPPMPETYIQGGLRDLHYFPTRHHAVYRTQHFYYIPTRPTPIPAPATIFARNISFHIPIRPVVPPLRMQGPFRPIFTPLNPFSIPVRPRFRRSMTSVYM